MEKTKCKIFELLILNILSYLIRMILTASFVSRKQFPDNFLLGTATGAYQVEGAWDEGKFILYSIT